MSGDSQHDEQDATMRALSVALQHHAALRSEQRIICRLLQVSKCCRAAVQQSVAAATDVAVITACPKTQVSDTAVMTQLGSFASWLPKHAGLLRSISIHIAKEYVGEARPMLEHSFQLAGAAWSAAGPATAQAAEPAAGPAAERKPLCLEHFSSDGITSPAILSALPTTLTQLLLNLRWTSGTEVTALAAPLGSLTALQQLGIWSPAYRIPLPASYVSAVGRLTRLTQLQLDGLSKDSDLRQLPVQLQHLKLTFSWTLAPAGGCCVDLRHLTRLQQLELDFAVDLLQAHGSGLPAQLQRVQLYCNWGSAIQPLSISSLQHLQHLTLTASGDGPQQLRSLAALPQLQLSLSYGDFGGVYLDTIRRAAPAWGQLPQLCSLKIKTVELQPDTAVELMRRIGAATSLIKLELVDFNVLGPEPDELDGDQELPPRIALCEHLSRLTRLQELQLESFVVEADHTYVLEQQDARHLSTLTTLTKLYLGHVVGGVNDGVAALLAIELLQLQWLSVRGLSSAAALPGIGKLRGLRHLEVGDDCGRPLPANIAQQGLKYLTQLSQLTHLGGFGACGAEELAGFWAAVWGQGRQQ